MHRRIVAVFAASLVLLVGLLTAPANADTERTSCGGTLIWSKPIRTPNGTRIGELDVYWNAAKARNCAITKHGGPTWGKSLYTVVFLWVCQETEPGSYCNTLRYAEDQQYYKYQAGPVSLFAGKHCVEAIGTIHWRGRAHTVRTGGRDHIGRFC